MRIGGNFLYHTPDTDTGLQTDPPLGCSPIKGQVVENVVSMAKGLTLKGLEPSTFELEVQCANHCATRP